MSAARHRNAWIWVAVAAMAVVSLARAQAGVQFATAYAHPVLEFLAGQQGASGHAPSTAQRLFERRSIRRAEGASLFASGGHSADSGAWEAILPVLFVGLVAPLSLISPRSTHSLRRVPSAPALPFSFQRPPPALA